MLHAKQIVTEHVVVTHRNEFLKSKKERQKFYLHRQDFEAVLFMQNFIKESTEDYDLLIRNIEKKDMELEVLLSIRTKVAFSNTPSLEQIELVQRKIDHRNRLKNSSENDKATAMLLTIYCRNQHQGGVIIDARSWTEKTWEMVISQSKIPGESLLWTWVNDDLHLVGFTE